MATDEAIEKLIHAQISNKEKLGFQSGGSGHMGHVSFRIDEIRKGEPVEDIIEINYEYTLIVETEFTYYPDNPPYEYPATGSIRINNKGEEV